MKKLAASVTLKVPLTPNFIHTNHDALMYSIEDLTDDQLSQLADEWKKDLLKKAAKRRIAQC